LLAWLALPSLAAMYVTLHRLEQRGEIRAEWGPERPGRVGARPRVYRRAIYIDDARRGRGTWPPPLALLLVALALAGCATTLTELRTEEPKHVGVFPVEARALATCTLDILDARRSYSLAYRGGPPSLNRLTERTDGIDLTGYYPGTAIANFEITTRRTDGGTRVEIRHPEPPSPIDYRVRGYDTLWPAVEQCGRR
jgi:hypothetical protein